MGKLLIGALIGLVLGGALTFLTFVGVPRSGQVPGSPILPPSSDERSAAAEVVLKQALVNNVLQAIFRDMNPPSFQLASMQQTSIVPGSGQHAVYAADQPCDGLIRILPQGSGVATGVKFENGKITAPIAFTGSYNTLVGCIQFSGWAKANLDLRFEASEQAVYGTLNVDTVNLDGVDPLISRLVTPIVQSTINARVNPIQILRGEQIAPVLKLSSTGGNLKAAVNDVRAEVEGDELRLFVLYSFSGTPAS